MGKFENPKDTYDVSNMLDVKLELERLILIWLILYIDNNSIVSNFIDISSINVTDVAYFNDYVFSYETTFSSDPVMDGIMIKMLLLWV